MWHMTAHVGPARSTQQGVGMTAGQLDRGWGKVARSSAQLLEGTCTSVM